MATLTRRALVTLALVLATGLGPTLLAEAPAVAPESVGLSSARLERPRAVMREYVEQRRVAGVVALVARNGRVAFYEAFGKADVEGGVPMQKDTIFRIASQTKAVRAWPS